MEIVLEIEKTQTVTGNNIMSLTSKIEEVVKSLKDNQEACICYAAIITIIKTS